jgi:hypothetical protein
LREQPGTGREPKLYLGSRRGTPAKPDQVLRGTPAVLPRFFGSEQVAELVARPGHLSFLTDLWPMMAKDIGWGHYTELFTGHPERVAIPFEEFSAQYAELGWDTRAMAALIVRAVPAAGDRLDLDALDRPLHGNRFADSTVLTEHMRGYLQADLARRADTEYSADLGAFIAMLSTFRQLAAVAASGKLAPDDRRGCQLID